MTPGSGSRAWKILILGTKDDRPLEEEMKTNMSDRTIGIILIAVGFLFVINNFGVLDLGGMLWRLTPLLLVWWGFHLLRKRGTQKESDGEFQVFGDRSTTTSSPFVKHSSAFGDIRLKIESPEFSGGNVSSVFGKVMIDLKDVKALGSYGQLDLHSVFGDVTIRLPEGMPYEIKGNNVFGNIVTPEGTRISGGSYVSPAAGAASQKLVLRPSIVFGDMEIIQ